MLVVDECHRAGSPENARALLGEYDATLGLSATPEREGDEGFDELISPALGSIIFRYGYPEARADGVIVDFDLVNINISSPADSVIIRAKAAQEKHLKSAPKRGESGQALEERAQRLARTALRTPWAVKLVLLHRQERVIVFHERVESLSKIVALLEKHGQNSVPYHSHLSKAHRRDNLKLFRQGIVNVLVTWQGQLDEGANVPEASVAVVARSTSSTRQRIQRLGRVLRHASGKHSALIYTLYAGEEEGLGVEKRRVGSRGGCLRGVEDRGKSLSLLLRNDLAYQKGVFHQESAFEAACLQQLPSCLPEFRVIPFKPLLKGASGHPSPCRPCIGASVVSDVVHRGSRVVLALAEPSRISADGGDFNWPDHR